MARMRTLKVGGINIRVHSRHAPEEYTAFWRTLYRMKRTYRRGVTSMMIGGMRQIDPTLGDESPIFGHLYRFINIDPNEPWFDIEKQQPADEADVAQVVIPPRLKPNLREIPYLFNVKKHQLYFLTGGAGDSVSAGSVDAFLEQLCAYPQVFMKFGEVNRTILTRAGLIEELLLWPEIRHITVVLERPNPSEYEDDARFAERMKRRHVSKETHAFSKAPEAETIVPDKEMVDMFKRAETDGLYEQRGVNIEGRVETASSREYPRQEVDQYDPDVQTQSDAFIELALKKFG